MDEGLRLIKRKQGASDDNKAEMRMKEHEGCKVQSVCRLMRPLRERV